MYDNSSRSIGFGNIIKDVSHGKNNDNPDDNAVNLERSSIYDKIRYLIRINGAIMSMAATIA